MVQRSLETLINVDEIDETAWLEETAQLVRDGRYEQIDAAMLAEYLTDMAKRDRREVVSRLVILLIHLLKWEYQAERRSRSWIASIMEQQRELRQIVDSATLYNHAVALLPEAYRNARKEAAVQTGLDRNLFPDDCPWTLETMLADRGEDS